MTSVYPSSSSQMSIKVCWGGSSIVLKDSWGLLVQSWETVASNLLRNIKHWVTSAGSLGFANSQLSAGAPYFTWKDRISAILLLQCYPATDVRGLFLEVTKCSRFNEQISLPNHCFQAATCIIDLNLFLLLIPLSETTWISPQIFHVHLKNMRLYLLLPRDVIVLKPNYHYKDNSKAFSWVNPYIQWYRFSLSSGCIHLWLSSSVVRLSLWISFFLVHDRCSVLLDWLSFFLRAINLYKLQPWVEGMGRHRRWKFIFF